MEVSVEAVVDGEDEAGGIEIDVADQELVAMDFETAGIVVWAEYIVKDEDEI